MLNSIRTRIAGGPAAGLLAAAFYLVPLALLAPLVGCSTPASGASSSTRVSRSTDIDGDLVRVKISHGWSSVELKMRGDVTLNDDDSGVTGIESGGYFVLAQREGMRVRRVRIVPEADGSLAYSGNAADSVEELQAWVAQRLPDLVEESGLWAEERARRLLGAEGVDGVLSAIARIEHDHTKSVYFRLLIDEGDLSPADFERLEDAVAEHVRSDYHLAEILGQVLRHRVGRDVAGDGLFRAIAGIDSAYHRAQVLMPLADRVSDRELPAYMTAVSGIDSDYHRQEVIGRLLDQRDLSEAAFVGVLDQIGRMGSDFHAAELLRRMSDRLPEAPGARAAYFQATRALGSDFHKAEVLTAVVRVAKRDDALLLDVIEAATTLGSDHHLGQVLGSVLDSGDPGQPVLRGLLAAVKEHLGGSYQRGQLLERITDRLTI